MAKRASAPVQLPSLEQIEQERKRLNYKHTYQKALAGMIYALLIVAACAVLIATLFLPVLQISGTSMEPTLFDGDVVLLIKNNRYERGELCSFAYENKYLVKRIIGIPGDVIEIDHDGNVYVNDEKLDEPYVVDKALGECDIEFPYQVPDGKYFFMGDQRATSIDSRSSVVGCISKDQIIGRVFLRIWPLKELSLVE